jgi:cytochrome c553
MPERFVLIMLALSFLGLTASAFAAESGKASSDKLAAAQTKHTNTSAAASSTACHASKKKKKTVHRMSSRLVPPPPAYMPTILPENYFRSSNASSRTETDEQVAEKPENPYAKYFYSRQGEIPKATTARSGVTTWATLH